MTDLLLRILLGVTFGLAFVLLARKPARKVFGAAPAFTLWLLPVLLIFAPLLPSALAPARVWTMPAIVVSAQPAFAGTHAPSGSSWMPFLVLFWSIGAAIALCRFSGHDIRRLRGLAPTPQDWRAAIADAAPELDPRCVRVHAAGPAVFWALRTRVLLPRDFTQRFDAGARRLVLRHEATHVRRGDALWLLLAEFLCAMLWFHPLAWFALPRFRLDQELACDERTLRSLAGEGSSYARTLLESAAAQPLPALIPWLSEPQLKERIAMISNDRPGALRRHAGFVAIAALLTCSLLIAGAETPVQAAAHASSTATPPSMDVTMKNTNPPKYPEEALKKKHQGRVMLDVTVDAAGNIKGVAIDPDKTNAPPELQTSALQAAAGWKFNPGTKDGHPVGGRLQVPVNFSLNPSPCQTSRALRVKKNDGKQSFTCVDGHRDSQVRMTDKSS